MPQGVVVLVVGPSGAGKDTLIALVKQQFVHDQGVCFPRRVVTRPADGSEDNIAVTLDDYAESLDKGDYVLSWYAHGHHYAIPDTIQDDLMAGRIVVLSVSRTIIAKARRIFAHVSVVYVTAPVQVREERLTKRRREADIRERISRKVDGDDREGADCLIENTQAPEIGAGLFADFLRKLKAR